MSELAIIRVITRWSEFFQANLSAAIVAVSLL